jgi:nucleoid-associated protein YgaU
MKWGFVMAKDAKIGSLIGLILIFIVAFVINGFTRSGGVKDNSTPSAVAADNTTDNDADRQDFINWPTQGQRVNDLPTDDGGDTGSSVLLPATTPTVSEPARDEEIHTPEPDVQKPILSEVYYTVLEGDNLAEIAKKFYGPKEGNKRANILRIFLANQNVLNSPHELLIGQKLRIPPLKTKETGGGRTKSVFTSSMFETATSIGRKPLSEQQSQLYAVQEGDSLWSIADTLLGDGSRYKEISRLNASILRDEDQLTVGMRLRIPAQ